VLRVNVVGPRCEFHFLGSCCITGYDLHLLKSECVGMVDTMFSYGRFVWLRVMDMLSIFFTVI
jgi:hypothetical protein